MKAFRQRLSVVSDKKLNLLSPHPYCRTTRKNSLLYAVFNRIKRFSASNKVSSFLQKAKRTSLTFSGN
ncbi:MAG TPA: hypothetical protein EYP59_07445 [Thiotrichaceae bacterium]|nr:hypothetical protein [Thiotrichaceae bacterium]